MTCKYLGSKASQNPYTRPDYRICHNSEKRLEKLPEYDGQPLDARADARKGTSCAPQHGSALQTIN